jgi:hypothetical protein
MALGLVVIHQSWTMDRLEAQGADPWSAPGLVPGILGGVLTLLGLALLVRSLRSVSQPSPMPSAEENEEERAGRRRLAVTLLLCLLLVFGLIGHGLPFWLGAGLFVAAFVIVFNWRERKAKGQLGRGVVTAAAYGLVMGVTIHLLFQELFLVRLP